MVSAQRLNFGSSVSGVRATDVSGAAFVHATTDENGFFLLQFTFDPLYMGNASGGLNYHLIAQQSISRGNGIARSIVGRAQGEMVPVISLRNIADGVIPDPRDTSSIPGFFQSARRLMQQYRSVRNPGSAPSRPSGGRPSPGSIRTRGFLITPSAEFVTFFGSTQITI